MWGILSVGVNRWDDLCDGHCGFSSLTVATAQQRDVCEQQASTKPLPRPVLGEGGPE